MITDKLQKLFSKASAVMAGRRQERRSTLESFVVDAADGRDIDTEELADLLESLGMSLTDFQSGVELVLQRRQWSETHSREPHWRAENDRLAKERVKFKEEEEKRYAEVKAWSRQTSETLRDQEAMVQQKLNECSTARMKLEETSGRNREIMALYNEKGQLVNSSQSQWLDRDFRDAEAAVKSLESSLQQLESTRASDVGAWACTYKEPIAAMQDKLRIARAKRDRLKKERDERDAAANAMQGRIDRVQEEAMQVA